MTSVKVVGMLRKSVISNHELVDLPAKYTISKNPKVMVDCRPTGLALVYGQFGERDWEQVRDCFNSTSGLSLDVEYELLNQVIVIDIGFKINLESTCRNLLYADYEPEQFPAIIYQEHDKLTYLIFHSGKISVTGIKKDVLSNLDYIDEILDIKHELVRGGIA